MKHKIVVTAIPCGIDLLVTATAEDGEIIARHICSKEANIDHDTGFTSDWQHDKYDKYYPDGWELIKGAIITEGPELATEDLTCPFCGDIGYDKCGLKWHLMHSCDDYENTEEE